MRNLINYNNRLSATIPGTTAPWQPTFWPGPFAAVARRPFRPDFNAWLSCSYKPLTVLVVSGLALLLCHLSTHGTEVMELAQNAAFAGAGAVVLSIVFSPEWTRKAKIATFTRMASLMIPVSATRAFSQAGSLVFGLMSLLLVYANHHSQFTWTVYPTLSLLSGFALGSSLVMLLVITLEGKSSATGQTNKSNYTHMRQERLEVLIGTIAAGVLLGTTLVEINAFRPEDAGLAAGIVWLPVMLAWCGVCTSLGMRQLLAQVDLPAPVKRILNVFVLLIVAYTLVVTMLPAYWVVEGEENLSSEIFLAAGAGSVGSLVLLEAAYGYQWLRGRYYAWVFGKPEPAEVWYLLVIRHLFRAVCLSIPVLVLGCFLKYAFEHVGLYGIVIAAIAMLSNLNAQLIFGKKVIV